MVFKIQILGKQILFKCCIIL